MQWVAHRGNARDWPENTLPAFQSALDLGVTHLELDVQLSADRVAMVLHDDTLRRTTGRRGRVFDHPAAELATFDAAAGRRFRGRVRGATIPRLVDVLALLGPRPDVTLFVEIKEESLRHFGLDETVGEVVRTLAAARAQCVVISFDLTAVQRARALGHARIGWVLPRYNARTRRGTQALLPEFVFVDRRRLPARGPLWRGPWRWVVYEVDRVTVARRLAARGIELLETMAVAPMLGRERPPRGPREQPR